MRLVGFKHSKVNNIAYKFSSKKSEWYKGSSRSTCLGQMEHQIFTQRVLRTSVLEQKNQSIWEVNGCDRCSVAIENQILFTKVIKYVCGWLVLLKMSALESMKLILLYSVFDVTRLFRFVYLKWSCHFPGHNMAS